MTDHRPISWQDEAECLDTPWGLFFPDSRSPDKAQVREALSYCDRCSVIEQCLEYNLATFDPREDIGIWGGKTRAERRPLRKARRELEKQSQVPRTDGVVLQFPTGGRSQSNL